MGAKAAPGGPALIAIEDAGLSDPGPLPVAFTDPSQPLHDGALSHQLISWWSGTGDGYFLS